MGTEADTCRKYAEVLEHLPPEQLVIDIMQKEQRILEIMGEIQQIVATKE